MPVLCIGAGVISFLACTQASSPGTTSTAGGYIVTYTANGATTGSAPTDSNEYQQGSSVTVLGNIAGMTKTNCSFSGWNTKIDGSGNGYAVGAVFVMGSTNVILYAQWAATGTPLQATGIGLVSWGGNLYILGGLDASGAYRSEVWRAAVGSNGGLGAWSREAFNLPQGLAFASCVAFGNMVYVIGGRNSGGLVNTIYFTMINSDGSLGFTSGWATNARTLPVARSGAAPLVYEGRIFIFGGETATGTTSSIIDAGIWNDHELGQWYAATNSLPSAGKGYAAVNYGGAFWVIGGDVNVAYSASPDINGLPGPWTTGALPGAALYPALASTADGLVMLGGSDSSSTSYARTQLLNGSAWTSSAAIATFGPHCAVVAGTLFAPGNVEGSAAPSIQTRAIATDRADAPRVSPGSGVMKTGSSPAVVAYPGDTIQYTTATYGATPADPATGTAWNTASPPTIANPTTYAFRAFHSGAQPSEIVYASYHTLASSMFMLLQATLYPNPSSNAYSPYSLTETYSNGSSTPVSSVWYQIIVSSVSTVGLGWEDSSTSPASYSAAIRLSLFEDVGCSTPVQETNGSELYQLSSTTTGSTIATASLGPGTYYLLVESTNGDIGGSFGLMVQ